MQPIRRTSAPPAEAAAPPVRTAEAAALLGGILVLAFAAFGAAVGYGFVYDDKVQILQNTFLPDPGRWGEALLSDVWAFKGERNEAWSNYWRPSFVALMIANWSAFGAAPAGWHWGNLLLHGMATWLAVLFARTLGLGVAAGAVLAALLAVHPTRPESVVWIAGSPDLLMGIGVFGALGAWLRAFAGGGIAWRAAACAAYLFALFSKEPAVLLPGVIMAIAAARAAPGGRLRRAAVEAAPFAAIAALWLVARHLVIGETSREAAQAHSLGETIAAAPSILVFYLRQALLPYEVSPMHPLRIGTLAAAPRFLFSCVLLAGALGGLAWALRKRPEFAAGGIGLFVLLLAPALYTRAFLPEELVHDRYLYVPLAGLLMAAIAVLEAHVRKPHAIAVAGGIAVAVCIPLARANTPVWASDESIWRRAVEADPESGFSWQRLGEELRAQARDAKPGTLGDRERAALRAEARAAVEKSLGLLPQNVFAHVSLALMDREDGRLEEAAGRFAFILSQQPGHAVARENLVVILQQAGRYDEAIALLEEGSRITPCARLRNASNIAVLHRMAGRVAQARRALESLDAEFDRAASGDELRGLFLLGELQREAGEREAAERSYGRVLARAKVLGDPAAKALVARTQAARALLAGKGGAP